MNSADDVLCDDARPVTVEEQLEELMTSLTIIEAAIGPAREVFERAIGVRLTNSIESPSVDDRCHEGGRHARRSGVRRP